MDTLSEEQQQRLNETKVSLRLENEKYLRAHPELRLLFATFISEALKAKPSNPQEFAAEFFTQDGLKERVMMPPKPEPVKFPGDEPVAEEGATEGGTAAE